MPHPTRESARSLASLAHAQGGYFTAKQALDSGYEYSQHVYHVSSGNFDRVEHGLYRLASVPPSEHDELIRLTLWSRNQKDEPQAVVSHLSALVLHDLSELLPGEIHLTVPPKFRKVALSGCILHKATLSDHEVEERSGFRVTTPLRTLLDVAKAGVSLGEIRGAFRKSLRRGMVRKSVLERAVRSLDLEETLSRALARTLVSR